MSKRGLIDQSTLAQQLRYVISGSAAAAVLFGVLVFLVEVVAMPATLASVVSFGAAIVVNYLLQHRFVFQVNSNHAVFFPRYLAVTLATMSLNAGSFWLLFEIAGLAYAISQAITLAVIVPINYVINRFYTFVETPAGGEAGGS